jgi:hypothetical protein
MFIGHFAPSLAAKTVAPRVPLWQLLLAGQAVDVMWAVFVWFGVERASIDLSLPSNPLTLGYMPYTHTLLGTAGWALLFGWLAARFAPPDRRKATFAAIALLVTGHWFLDLIVHRPDLAIAPGMKEHGLALWDNATAAFWTEGALIAACGAWLVARSSPALRLRRMALCGLLLALHAATLVIPPPPWLVAITISMLATFAVVIGAGLWSERPAS